MRMRCPWRCDVERPILLHDFMKPNLFPLVRKTLQGNLLYDGFGFSEATLPFSYSVLYSVVFSMDGVHIINSSPRIKVTFSV